MSTTTLAATRTPRMTTRAQRFAGTRQLVGMVLRRNRVWLSVWLLVLIAIPMLLVASFDSLYPTDKALELYARTGGSSPSAIALNGPGHGVDTLGGAIVFEGGGYLMIAIILMNIFAIGRNTRAEEEVGRLELIRSNSVGRHAMLAAALSVVVVSDVLLGAAIAGGMIALGLPATGAATFGAGLAVIGITFAALTAFTAQLAEYARGAYAMAGGILAAAYVLRAAGDIGDGTLSWFSPIGWVQATRPFADERWWPLLPAIGLAALLAIAALRVEGRRDHGAGVVRPRPGSPTASPMLLRQLGLAFRLQRGSLTGWVIGIFAGGLAFGSVARETEDMMADNPGLRNVFDPTGQLDLTDLFFQLTLMILALAISGYVIGAILRVRAEETAGHAEPLLAGALSRPRWMLSQLAVPIVASALLMGLGGLGAGLMDALRSDNADQILRVTGAALVWIPAIWLLAAIAVLLIGLAPRAAAAAWAVLAACVVVALLGNALQLPGWVIDVSPFAHVPELPGGDMSLTPLLVMTGLAVALTVAGVAAFRRRDIG